MTLTSRRLALVTATLFAVTAAIDIPHEQAQPFASTLDYVLEAVFALSLASAALTLGTLAGAARGLAARLGFGAACAGSATLAVVAGATHVNGEDVLGPGFVLGLLGTVIGYLVLAVADLRGRVEPRYAGLALLGSTIAMVALGEGLGLLGWTAGWVAVAALSQAAPVRSPRQEVIAA
jgi:hypothetical protein